MEDLDALFAAAKSDVAEPSGALIARVLADAAAHQPKATARAVPVAPGFWAGLAAIFGGTGALAGIGSAAIAGLVIGFVQPVDLGQISDSLAGVTLDSVELIPDLDALLAGE